MSAQQEITVAMIPLKDIDANRERNVRVDYREIEALASTIQDQGQITPLRVRPAKEQGRFELVAGFRRFAALQKLKAGVARCEIVRNLEDKDQDWQNMLENVQRNNLSAYETAAGFIRQQEKHKWTGEEMSKRLGMEDGKARFSAANVNNMMRAYRKLCPEALEAWRKGQLTNEGAFTLASRKPDEQKEMLGLVKGRSGRALTEAVDAFDNPKPADGEGKGGNGKEPMRASRPTVTALEKAVKWAKDKGFEEALPALRWAAGDLKKLEIDGHTFSTRAPEKQEEAK